MFYSLPLLAGKPYTHGTSGRLLLIDDLGAASSVDVQFVTKENRELPLIPGRTKAFRIVQDYEAVIFTSAVNATIRVFLSYNDVQLGMADGAAVAVPGGVVITNTVGQRVPVDVGGAVINVTAVNVGINNNDPAAVPVRNQALTTFVHRAAVAVGVAATSLGIADATLRKLIFRNDHATAKIALGGAGVTLANAPIVLLPGDIWKEEDAAGAEWFAISDTAGTNVQIMGLK